MALQLLKHLLTCTVAAIWLTSYSAAIAADNVFEMPNLASMIELALNDGEINTITGQRHYSGIPVIGWDPLYTKNHITPVFHTYGYGGSGLTLAPSIAKHIGAQIGEQAIRQDAPGQPEATEIIVLGAGYTGVFTALELRRYLDNQNKQHIPVRILAHAFPQGISTLKPEMREPGQEDNYSSKASGGWIMPVSIEPLKDNALWCSLVRQAQSFWSKCSSDAYLSKAIHKTRSLVFYDQLSEEDVPEDKSGVRAVNNACPKDKLYPENQFKGAFYSPPLTLLYFDNVVTFDNVIQADTVSVLLYFTRQLIDARIEFIQTAEPVKNWAELSPHFKASRTIIVNASGNGACSVFGCTASQPVRGDLVILKIPTGKLTETMREVSKFGFWASGTHYVFLRYSLNGKWLEVVLGGTFLKDDHDLTVRPETVSHIIVFWLNFFHHGSGMNIYHEETNELVSRVMNKLKRSESLDNFEPPF